MNSAVHPSVPGFGCFVTGTDTGIGKTLISCALLHALSQAGVNATGMKPVAAGAEWVDPPDGSMGGWHNEDVDLLTDHSRLKLPVELVSPYLFRTAAAPHIAAMHERKTIELAPILNAYESLRKQSHAVVVEGVGGFRVPFSDTCDSADLAQQLALPVVLVVGVRLGCLNHALLTAEAIAARGLHFAGWVANIVDENMLYPDDNITALSARLSAPLLGCVPRLSPAWAALAADCLNFSVLPNWPSLPTLSDERNHV